MQQKRLIQIRVIIVILTLLQVTTIKRSFMHWNYSKQKQPSLSPTDILKCILNILIALIIILRGVL